MDSHGGPGTRGREPQPEGGSGVKGRLPGWQVWRSHWEGVSVDWGHHSPWEQGQELGADPGTPTRSQHLTFRVSLGVPRERGHSRR